MKRKVKTPKVGFIEVSHDEISVVLGEPILRKIYFVLGKLRKSERGRKLWGFYASSAFVSFSPDQLDSISKRLTQLNSAKI